MRKSCIIGSLILFSALITWAQDAVTAHESNKGLAGSMGLSGKIIGNVPESAIVNVLELGVKNDGSEDVSAIINEATKKSGCISLQDFTKLKIRYSLNTQSAVTDIAGLLTNRRRIRGSFRR